MPGDESAESALNLKVPMPEKIPELTRCLNSGGLSNGLAYLNRRVLHRFTAVYKFQDDAFWLMAFADKLNEAVPDALGLVAFDDSFCQYSIGLGCFVSPDTAADKRLDGHVHQATLGSYVGLPIENQAGGIYGTICHMDLKPQSISDNEFGFLLRSAEVLSHYVMADSRGFGAPSLKQAC